MMWGRWQVLPAAPLEIDRRERARLISPKGCAILFSAPIFEIGQGDPYQKIEILAQLGPDALPYDGDFDAHEFMRRLEREENAERSIGAVLPDQSVVAGLGNYLRADILFRCRIDPWKPVADLSLEEADCLIAAIPELSRRAYLTGGTTIEEERERIRNDATLLYRAGSEWGTRFYIFRRTNLPCLRCGATIRQLRQATKTVEGPTGIEEKTRIMYFCPQCQGVTQPMKARAKSRGED
jgi:formamidopyrimidine-DNA glycosylase